MKDFVKQPKHITDQLWSLEVRESDPPVVALVGEDGTTVLTLARPDFGSCLFIAGYIASLQAANVRGDA